jgi:uncharacterized repeat protein (TIGR02543 family)
MSRFDESLPGDVRDIAERLTEARATLSPLELDELRGRVHRSVTRRSPGRRTGRMRRTSLAAILAAALMLTSGAGAVIAAGYFGGNSGGNYFGGDSHVFEGTSFDHFRDSSFCQYHGPQTFHEVFPTIFGVFIITITTDCGRVIDVHISFIPFFPPHHHFPFPGGFGWFFGGHGPEQFTSGPDVSTTAPDGTTGMTIVVDGQTFTIPLDGSGGTTGTGTQQPPPPAPTFSVSFNGDGGSGSMATETDSAPTALTADGFTRTGYTFAGWNTSPTGHGTAYADGATYPFTANATLFAQWKPNPTFTVSFNGNGGFGGMTTETRSAATALLPEGFTRPGYTFAGWNTSPSGNGTAYANGATYAFTANATLYAQWTPARRH